METLTLIIVAIIAITMWLLFRPVILWYYKIGKIEALFEEQIKILKLVHKSTLEAAEKSNKVDGTSIENVIFSFPEWIKYSEIDVIKSKAQSLQKGQLLTIHLNTRELLLWQIKEYNENMSQVNDNTTSVVAIKK